MACCTVHHQDLLCMQSFPHVTLPGKLGKGPQQGVRCHPYQTLLQMYLSKFLPRNAAPSSGEFVSMAVEVARRLLHLCSFKPYCSSRICAAPTTCDAFVCLAVIGLIVQPKSYVRVAWYIHGTLHSTLHGTFLCCSCHHIHVHASVGKCSLDQFCLPPQLLVDLHADAACCPYSMPSASALLCRNSASPHLAAIILAVVHAFT